nr:cyclic nucleotide-binding domain-containing thioredoxin-disulfide reductase [uncultured Nocardioides sp.]
MTGTDVAPGVQGGEPQLTSEQFQRLSSYGERRTVQAGQVLYATGDSTYDLFLIESAAVDVVREASVSEPEHVVYTRSAGDFMGELSILTGQKVYVTARVREQGVVVQLHARAFRAALAEQVDIADVLIEAFRLRRRIMLDSAGSALEIVGRPESAGNRALRTYAARLQLPHSAFDADSVAGQSLMAAYGLAAEDLPAAVLFDRVLVRATPQDVARAVGLSFEPSDRDVDLVVVGAGPAGLAAAVYGASEGLVTVMLDAEGPGGQAATTSRIENYLGFPGGISGDELTRLALVQALKFGAQVYAPCHVVGLRGEPDGPVLTLQDGSEVRSRAVIVATGAHYRRLSVARWEEFEGRGSIRYSATELDVAGCESRPVTVVGGANSAGQAALFLASRGCRVDVVVRGGRIDKSMSSYLLGRLEAHTMVTIWTNARLLELCGADELEAVVISADGGVPFASESSAIFCFIGAEPETSWMGEVARDVHGFVLTDVALAAARVPGHADGPLPYETSLPRVFAAGDVRAGSMKRVASAVGEGASAVASVHRAFSRLSDLASR